jgi:hypothetical protein
MNPTGASVQMPQSQSSDILQSVLDRLEKIDSKLGHLSKIESKVDAINQRLNSMDYKITEIEKSQTFLCEQYDSINTTTNLNKVSVEHLKEDVNKLIAENVALRQKNETLADDVIDMKCRSMKDNLLFFGIPEGTSQIPGRRFVPSVPSALGSVPGENNLENELMEHGLSEPISEQTSEHSDHDETVLKTANAPLQLYSSVAAGEENCKSKVHDFCNKILRIHEPEKTVNIIVAHRIGRYVPGKIRPIVARLEPDSKMTLKRVLKYTKLKETPYNVSDQYPQEVKDKRKTLIPDLVKARNEGKTAFLRRDKLIIQENRYNPHLVNENKD